MDRRAALKKLAAGGAIAAGGSFVLSSNQVAFAASGGTSIPGPGDDLPISSGSTQGQVSITDSTYYTCPEPGGGEPTVTYSWKINGYNLRPPGNSTIELVDANTGEVLQTAELGPTCESSCANLLYQGGSNSAFLRRDHSKLKDGDEYDIGLMVEWQCGSVTTRVYSVRGIYPGPATAWAV